jgi:DNA-binding response OmpR family regulator
MDKRLIKLENALSNIELLMSQLALHDAIKSAINDSLAEMREALIELKLDSVSPDNPTLVADKDDIVLKSMTIMPLTREIEMDGKVVKVSPGELFIMVQLAKNVGKPVRLNVDHSLLTQMSSLRRYFPKLKALIERVENGVYVLHDIKS